MIKFIYLLDLQFMKTRFSNRKH